MDYLCNICNTSYKTTKTLLNHNNKFHNTDNKLIFNCSYCDSKFTRKNNMVMHIKNKCKNKKEIEDKSLIQKQITEMQNKIKILETKQPNNKIIETTPPINNQLINIIMDKNKIIEELKNPNINNQQSNNIIIEDIIEPGTLVLNNVVIISRIKDNYINATQLCQAGGKKFSHWFSLDSTKILINTLSKKVFKNGTDPDAWIQASGPYSLIDITKGGNELNYKTHSFN